jgi:hypothetical protein
MGKIRPGNKQNSIINGEYAKHVRKRTGEKRITSGKRRARLKKDTDERLDTDTSDQYCEDDDMN